MTAGAYYKKMDEKSLLLKPRQTISYPYEVHNKQAITADIRTYKV
jgi:hypothetical protein